MQLERINLLFGQLFIQNFTQFWLSEDPIVAPRNLRATVCQPRVARSVIYEKKMKTVNILFLKEGKQLCYLVCNVITNVIEEETIIYHFTGCCDVLTFTQIIQNRCQMFDVLYKNLYWEQSAVVDSARKTQALLGDIP